MKQTLIGVYLCDDDDCDEDISPDTLALLCEDDDDTETTPIDIMDADNDLQWDVKDAIEDRWKYPRTTTTTTTSSTTTTTSSTTTTILSTTTTTTEEGGPEGPEGPGGLEGPGTSTTTTTNTNIGVGTEGLCSQEQTENFFASINDGVCVPRCCSFRLLSNRWQHLG